MQKLGACGRTRGQNGHDGLQLDLFGPESPKYENLIDAIRLPGRETLAGVLPEDGRGSGSDCTLGALNLLTNESTHLRPDGSRQANGRLAQFLK
jgi:hypothetical protein